MGTQGNKSKNQEKSSGSAGRQSGIHKGWYTHGYLPHCDQAGTIQVITYRLADSLSQEYVNKMRLELRIKNNKQQENERRIKIESILDRSYGSCVLQNSACAKIITESWKYFDGSRYDLISYVVMPNHIHVLIKIYDGFELGKTVRSWKSFSSRKIHEYLHDTELSSQEKLWQRGYWDRYIRDEKHFNQAIEYIKKNFDNGGIMYCLHPGIEDI
jgi:REP-associated tyrosine transposase